MVAVARREMLGTVLGVVPRVGASDGRDRVLALGNIRSRAVVVIIGVPAAQAVARPQLARRVRNCVDAAGPYVSRIMATTRRASPSPWTTRLARQQQSFLSPQH